jgi:hypothetical protein
LGEVVVVVVVLGLQAQPEGCWPRAVPNLAVDWLATPAKAPTASRARRLERSRVFIGGSLLSFITAFGIYRDSFTD